MEEINQIIVFKLGNESYGVPVEKIKEIIKIADISSIPETPEYIEGMINIRGNIYVIFNIRKKFGLVEKPFDENTKIILASDQKIGFIVDEVSEIIHVSKNDMEATLNMPLGPGKNYIEGIAKVYGNTIVVLNLGNTLSILDENGTGKVEPLNIGA